MGCWMWENSAGDTVSIVHEDMYNIYYNKVLRASRGNFFEAKELVTEFMEDFPDENI